MAKKTVKSTVDEPQNFVEEPQLKITESFKATVLQACAMLSQYQRLLESQGKATAAKKVKDIKDELWKQCQEHGN